MEQIPRLADVAVDHYLKLPVSLVTMLHLETENEISVIKSHI